MSPKNFMTSREKDYVAECLKKNMRYFRSDIEYARLFNPNKMVEIRVDDGQRKDINLVFGKESKKSSRRPISSCGMEMEDISHSLRIRFLLDELIDLYTIRKYCKLTESEFGSNVESFRSILLVNFKTFVSITKFLRFLEDYLQDVGENERREVIELLQETLHMIEDASGFYSFINSSINAIPHISRDELKPEFISTFLFFPCGVILATSLLIQNEGLNGVFYEAFIGESTGSSMKEGYIWQFLSVLMSLIDDARRTLIVKKTRPHLLDIIKRSDDEELSQIQLFLSTIGVGVEDIEE